MWVSEAAHVSWELGSGRKSMTERELKEFKGKKYDDARKGREEKGSNMKRMRDE
jgi:hypothetical protein